MLKISDKDLQRKIMPRQLQISVLGNPSAKSTNSFSRYISHWEITSQSADLDFGSMAKSEFLAIGSHKIAKSEPSIIKCISIIKFSIGCVTAGSKFDM